MARIVPPTMVLAAGLLLAGAVNAQTSRYVAVDGSDAGNDCLDPASPCASIAHAIEQAGSGNVIRAAAGVYTESLNLSKSLVLQGAGADATVIQAHAQPGQAAGRVIFAGNGLTVAVRDLTIRHGNAVAGGTQDRNGAGLYNDGADLVLEGVVFMNNIAGNFGGGLFSRNSSPELQDIAFISNTAFRGGGLYSSNGSPVMLNAEFRGNQVTESGGGFYIRDCVEPQPQITNALVVGNLAAQTTSWGGGIYNTECSPVLTNITVSGNRVEANNGGGMYTFGGNASPQIRNSIFWNNQADDEVGTARANLWNNNIDTVVSYSLVQGCKPAPGEWESNAVGFPCGTDGGNNLVDQSPLFVDTPSPAAAPTLAGNLRLQNESPAIDAGNNAFVAGIHFDLDGMERIIGPAVDLGPYEIDTELIFRDGFES